jgi:peptidoglycan/LPS O-acetylase OafA/YrhL
MRRDIQFLRGVAVLFVVLFHAGVGFLANGYLGVDIFFVISGFLITKIILKGLEDKTFSFYSFYLRRAKRLLPALYCTLIVTTIIAYKFLTLRQWDDYIAQLIGSITFTANMVLPFQTGYFEGASEAKLLLHIWSLSLEEQYYFFLPLFLFLIPRNWQKWCLSLSLISSLFLCLYLVSFPFSYWRLPGDSAEWAFYLFPSRAWELLMGSLSAWIMHKHPSFSLSRYVKLIAAVGLFFIVSISVDAIHPRGGALITVVLTSLIVLGRDDWLPNYLPIRMVEKVGDWSYSLYLVHWPILAFATIAFLGNVPATLKISLAAFSIFLAYLQYRFVEERFRHGFKNREVSTYRLALISTMVVALLPLPMVVSSSIGERSVRQDFDFLYRANYGLGEFCEQGAYLLLSDRCMTSKNPKIAVWGDSYAMHLVPGLLKNKNIENSLVQITKSACAPILGLARVTKEYSESWAKGCNNYNSDSIEYIANSKSIKYVIMSSPLTHYFEDVGQRWLFGEEVIQPDFELAMAQFISTIEALQKSGKIPILVSPPPRVNFNIGDCLERETFDVVSLGREDCNFSRLAYEEKRKEVIAALLKVQISTNVEVLWIDDLTCDQELCKSKIDDVYLYRDGGHLSYAGSELLIQKFRAFREM